MTDRIYRRRRTAAALALCLALPAAQVQAGLLDKFKELLTTSGTAMENYNKNMWTGDASVGNSLIKGVKDPNKKWHQVFDDVNGAHNTAMTQAGTDVKAFLKVLSDIVFWLPKKLQELFNKLMDKVRAFMEKLGKMNQGATVKDRWNNMVSGGGAPPAGGAPEAAASMDGSEIDGVFSGMLGMTRASLDDESKKQQSEAAIRATYLGCWKLVLQKNAKAEAVALLREGPALYELDPDGMHAAVEELAGSIPSPLSPELVKASSRLAKASKVHAAGH